MKTRGTKSSSVGVEDVGRLRQRQTADKRGLTLAFTYKLSPLWTTAGVGAYTSERSNAMSRLLIPTAIHVYRVQERNLLLVIGPASSGTAYSIR